MRLSTIFTTVVLASTTARALPAGAMSPSAETALTRREDGRLSARSTVSDLATLISSLDGLTGTAAAAVVSALGTFSGGMSTPQAAAEAVAIIIDADSRFETALADVLTALQACHAV